MSMRVTSGRFLPSFGRKTSENASSPTHPSSGAFGNGGGGGRFSGEDDAGPGLGTVLGKKIAHQSFLPALGNQDLRMLQDVISSEKGVLTSTEKLASETQKAAVSLPAWGSDEGPDLQDVLTHSSTLLSHLSTALNVFATHQANMRATYKRIRQREEELDDLRRRRRATGAKADTAEKKLAKMGPENKQLQQQTETLEKLRMEMRQMDTDIVMDEAKLGDFKRQIVKEALSLKFGGLEELGEKMCIIGELGKLILEEIPLEETPPGYGRAVYGGHEKTRNAVDEATRCLATVQFHAASATPRPPGLPHPKAMQPLTTPNFPAGEHRIAAAEDYAHYPGNVASPETKGPGSSSARQNNGDYGLDENPYGGYADNDRYKEYGGLRGDAHSSGVGSHVVWQGPTEDALNAHNQSHGNNLYGNNGAEQPQGLGPGPGLGPGHDYEYEQQKQLDAEEAAWREDKHQNGSGVGVNNGIGNDGSYVTSAAPVAPAHAAPWEPLNVKRGTGSDAGRTSTPPTHSQPHGDQAPSLSLAPSLPLDFSTTEVAHNPTASPTSIDLPPPPSMASLANQSGAGVRATTAEGYYTPNEDADFEDPIERLEQLEAMEKTYTIPTASVPTGAPALHALNTSDLGASAGAKDGDGGSGRASPLPLPTPTSVPLSSPIGTYNSGSGAKISAAAFRRTAKPRVSSTGPGPTPTAGGSDEEGVKGPRRLPVPPLVPAQTHVTPAEAEATADTGDRSPPPVYGQERLR